MITRKEMDNISLGIAFAAGIISFLSPCVLPLIPAYISFLSGISLKELKSREAGIVLKAVSHSFFFVLGFSFIFMSFGASASFLGKFLARHRLLFSKMAGIIIIILGLHLLGVIRIAFLFREKRLNVSKQFSGFIGSFLIGIAFGFGWTPCVGPILAGILTIAAMKQTLQQGVILLAGYSLGLGIPFILTALSVATFLKLFQRYRRFMKIGELIAGILLLLIGGLIFWNRIELVLRFIPSFFFKFSK